MLVTAKIGKIHGVSLSLVYKNGFTGKFFRCLRMFDLQRIYWPKRSHFRELTDYKISSCHNQFIKSPKTNYLANVVFVPNSQVVD